MQGTLCKRHGADTEIGLSTNKNAVDFSQGLQ